MCFCCLSPRFLLGLPSNFRGDDVKPGAEQRLQPAGACQVVVASCEARDGAVDHKNKRNRVKPNIVDHKPNIEMIYGDDL